MIDDEVNMCAVNTDSQIKREREIDDDVRDDHDSDDEENDDIDVNLHHHT